MESKMEIDQECRGSVKPMDKDADVFGGLTVGQVVGPGLIGKLSLQCGLREAAAALAVSGHSAAAVADSNGSVVGLLTENDVMRAYFEEAAPDQHLCEWLHGGMARAPVTLLKQLSVRPTDTLAEVAERMVKNAIKGDCACHHVLVQDGAEDEGGRCAVLSSLDMVQVLCRPEMWENPHLHHAGEAHATHPPGAAGLTVWDVMKPRDSVFTCLPTDSMRDVLRILLMSQQNSVLVVDEEGIYGIVTPRDAVRAFAEGVSSDLHIADWLRGLQVGVASRMIACDAQIGEAAAMMTARGLNHLVVVRPGGVVALGMLSSMDLVLCTRARTPLLRAIPQAGPTVGELVGQQWHLTAVCNRGATLAEAARFLASSGRTSAAVSLGGDSPPLGLLTESDIVRAYVDMWPADFTVERWLLVQESHRPAILPSLLVPPSVRMTEAACMMLNASKPGRDPCHHLVVKGPGLGWLGVFSALDVARALCALSSGLEVAKTGADQLKVSMVMKSLDAVPRCKPTDTIQQALQMVLRSHQNALLVVDEKGAHGIITPRCALEAMAEGVPRETTVAAWLQRQIGAEAPREVAPGARLLDAAAIMTDRNLHHLVVRDPSSPSPIGILSSLDLVRGIASIRCHAPFASLGWLWSCRGPPSCSLFAA